MRRDARWRELSGVERRAVIQAVRDGYRGDLLITSTMRWYRVTRGTPRAPSAPNDTATGGGVEIQGVERDAARAGGE